MHTPRVRRLRPLCRRRCARARDARRIVGAPAPRRRRDAPARPRREPAARPGRDLRHHAGEPARSPTMRARSSRGSSMGRSSTSSRPLYGTTLVCGFARLCGYPVGILANNGILFSRKRAEGSALHRAVLPRGHSAAVPAEHRRASWSARGRGGRHREGRREARHARSPARRVPKLTVVIGGSYGAGNYAMCGRAYCPALPVPVAQCANVGDGRRAGGAACWRPRARPAAAQGKAWDCGERTAHSWRRSASSTSARDIPTMRRRAAVGRRRDRSARNARACSGVPRRRAPRPGGGTRFAVFRM